ncbi:hypothetical protein F8M41_007842 [Gigaspora margarita]|uniref:Uncharacterized protein n=1 Tax=Gigaspora margarita TaxID=4874 RepID=A0A8H4A521_GIGMA|nr:hypothetical protein F8M41_007842 [Gigaspora margarita]
MLPETVKSYWNRPLQKMGIIYVEGSMMTNIQINQMKKHATLSGVLISKLINRRQVNMIKPLTLKGDWLNLKKRKRSNKKENSINEKKKIKHENFYRHFIV